MSWSRADWTPVANAIENFGTGLAGNALKKAQLDRRLGKDIVDYERGTANIDLDRARTRQVEMDMKNTAALASLFDPLMLTAQERTGIGVNAMAGRNVFADSLRGAQIAQTAQQVRQLFENGTPEERLTIVTDKPIMPYSLDSSTGAVINRLTGQVTADTPLATRLLSGSVAGPKFGELQKIYETNQQITDPYGGSRTTTFTDMGAMMRDIQAVRDKGLPVTQESLLAQRIESLFGGGDAASAVPPSPASQPPVGQGYLTQQEAAAFGPDLSAKIEELSAQYSAGSLTTEQYKAALRELGLK